MHKTWLFIFRQDLRIIDNVGFALACKQCAQVIPLFVFDTEVFARFPEDDPRQWFQREALEFLSSDIASLGGKLYAEYGKASEIIPKILHKYDIDAMYLNRSYGHGSVSRDKRIQEICEQENIQYTACTDYLMLEIDVVETRKVFTPFFKKRLPKVQEKYHAGGYDTQTPTKISTPELPLPILENHKEKIKYHAHPIRKVAWIRQRLTSLHLTEYDTTRNLPADTSGTTKLSPYLTFGVLWPREVFGQFVKSMSIQEWFPKEKNRADVIVSELAWREFRQHISYRFPATTYNRYEAFQGKRQWIVRENNEERYERRKNGTTWYPIVDAGMRQLKAENRMHNRVRMIVASFLTKDLLIDRRRWEKHFADLLIDYDRNVNIGNRQRSASVGADPKPLRIFNPILQSGRYDPLAEYILRRVPELVWQPIPAIHDPIKYVLDYHTPVVDHYVWSKIARQRYNEAKARYQEGLDKLIL